MQPKKPIKTQILDDFLPIKELTYWQARVTEASVTGTPFNPHGSLLFNKINELIGLVFVGAWLYRIPQGIPANPHQDCNQFAVVFFPFDNGGALAIYDKDYKAREQIDIKANRLVLLDCANQLHSQIAGQTPRYSVVFKYRPSQ